MTRRLFAGLAAAVLALGLAAPKAHAVLIYDWTGTCDTGCTGQATAVLTLADSYVPGNEVRNPHFISFSYSSTSGSFDTLADGLFRLSGRLPAMSGAANNRFLFTVPIFTTGHFSTNVFDRWRFGLRDFGTTPIWTLRQPTELSVPGPLSLLALGLAGLALAGWRRSKARA